MSLTKFIMAVTKAKKEEILKDLVDSLKSAKSVVFSHYRGLNVKSMQEMRKALRDNNSEFKVAKKTLIKLAAKDAGLPELPDTVLDGPVGVAISYDDEIAAAKAIYDFSKSHKEAKLIGAVIDGDILSTEQVNEFAQIPSKDELLAKLVGSLKAPISGFHGILHGVLRGFVGVLAAYKDSKPAEEKPVEEAKEEAPKEEASKEEPKAEQSEEKPTEEAPKQEAKAEEEAPKEEAKTEETKPVEEAPAKEEDKPAEEAPKEEAKAEEKPEASTEEASTDKPAETAPEASTSETEPSEEDKK